MTADMFVERDLHKQLDINAVQRALLMSVMARRQESKQQDFMDEFERDLLVFNPDKYREWIAQKDTVEEENEGVEWCAPQSREEFEAVARMTEQLVSGRSASDRSRPVSHLLTPQALAEMS